MSLLSYITNHIIVYEGLRLKPYKCPAGKLTCGYGRNLEDKGITEEEARYMLENDIEECFEDLETMVFCGVWQQFPEQIKLVFLDMRYNLGPSGFRLFKRMIASAMRHDWQGVRQSMQQSKWYNQVGLRSARLIELVDEVIG